MGVTGAIAGIGGAAASIFGAQTAASAQRDAASMATNAQLSMFGQTQQNLAPYIQAGPQALAQLQMLTGSGAGGNPLQAALTKPFVPTLQQLQQTPGYQFQLDQGLKATQNSYASKGLGTSGAAMKGAADYAEGLAGTSFQQQFQNYLSQNQQIYNMLSGQVQTGANAAAGQGQIGMNVGNTIGQNMIGAGAATAGGQIATGNALSGGLNTALLYSMLGKNQNSGAGTFNANEIFGWGPNASTGGTGGVV